MTILLRCVLGLLLAAPAGVAAAAEVRVFSSGAPSEVAKAIGVAFARDSGHAVSFAVATPGEIQKKLANGEKPDILIMPTPVIDRLEKAGALAAGTRTDLARVGIGVVVREGAPLPDISSLDAVRKLLLSARSVVHTNPGGSGFAGAAVARMIEGMGIAETIKPKLTLRQAIDGGVLLVAKGEAEVGLFNISEVLPVKGVTLVGPLPAEVQSYIVFSAAIHAGAASPDPARAFIKLLADPSTRGQWRAGGLESLSGKI
ncbi:MAG: substrate-binding domain-containing protein [Pseudomonadota bacterium]